MILQQKEDHMIMKVIYGASEVTIVNDHKIVGSDEGAFEATRGKQS